MDALLASAGPMKQSRPRGPGRPDRKPFPTAHNTVERGPDKAAIDPSLHSILSTTRVPSSFHQSNLATGSSSTPIKPDANLNRIQDKKLRAKVGRQNISDKRAKVEREEVNQWLNAPMAGGAGGIEVDESMGEKTWRVRQDEIVREVGVASSAKKFDLKMENMGSYKVNYTRNGR
jgi:U3 small nucleolar RNA-associated protein 7